MDVLKYLVDRIEQNMATDANQPLVDATRAEDVNVIRIAKRIEHNAGEKRKEIDPESFIGQLMLSAKAIVAEYCKRDTPKAKASSVTLGPRAKEGEKPKQSPLDGRKQLMGQKLG